MVAEARAHSEQMVGEAREEASRLATTAKRDYEAATSRAKAEADRLVENGNLSYEKAVQEGIHEQQRLVSLDAYRGLQASERVAVDRALAGTGCEALFGIDLRHRVGKRGFTLVAAGKSGART